MRAVSRRVLRSLDEKWEKGGEGEGGREGDVEEMRDGGGRREDKKGRGRERNKKKEKQKV